VKKRNLKIRLKKKGYIVFYITESVNNCHKMGIGGGRS
jgi:hypothetical protein